MYESRRKYIDVEATTEDEAWEKANETDKDDFIVDHNYDHWASERPYRIYEDNNKMFSVGDRVKITPDPAIKKALWNATGTISRIDMDTCMIDFDKKRLEEYKYCNISSQYIVSEDVE